MKCSELRDQLEKYHSESYCWALTCCSGDPSRAENVLQTMYQNVLEGRARFNGKAAFKTWLFSVIRKTAANQHRRAILYRLRLVRYQRETRQILPKESLLEMLYRSEIQTQFQRALAQLAPRQQQVLQLVFYHDLSLQETADVMGVSIGSVRVHYDRGKRRLRQHMEAWRMTYERR